MRTLLVASCLLLTAFSLVPTASATDDTDCRVHQNFVATCHSLMPLGDDNDCATVAVGNPGSHTGLCVRYGDGYLCPYFAEQHQRCILGS